jgi:2-polyprenyl-6-methoxyphenol hydroxylase-like FAD-dependent oxidoreductase
MPHRVSQKFVEAVLRRHAERLRGVSVQYGWRLVDFEEADDVVHCEIERVAGGHRRRVRCRYLFGADGSRSFVRERLGFGYVGETGVMRDFLGGRMYAPPDAANTYTPTACPGGRAPHLWLTDGRSLYDTFGFEWTLLRMRRDSPVAEDIAKAARGLALDLTVVDLDDDARDLYEADAALIRPDQIVAWRGSGPCDALQAVARMSGQCRTASGPSSPSPSAIGLSSGGQSATVPVE